MWYIAVTIIYINLSLPLHSVWLSEFFYSEISCNNFLNENYLFLNEDISNEFPTFKHEEKIYKLESTNFSCKKYNSSIVS